LMDLQMPEMDGITATRVLRGLSGPVSNIPIIAVTANAGPEERQQGAEAGINEFLEKPLDKERLTAALNRFGRHRTTTSANTYGVPAES
ncbi:MAG: response regulator, partial [Myxococcota bacterium]